MSTPSRRCIAASASVLPHGTTCRHAPRQHQRYGAGTEDAIWQCIRKHELQLVSIEARPTGCAISAAAGTHLVAVAQADSEVADGEHLVLWVVRLVAVALCDVHAAADALQSVQRLLCTDGSLETSVPAGWPLEIITAVWLPDAHGGSSAREARTFVLKLPVHRICEPQAERHQ